MTGSARLVLTSDDPELQARLQQAVDGFGAIQAISPTAANLLQALVETKPALLLVDLNASAPLHILIGLVRRADPALQAIAIGDSRNADAVLGAVRAGVADFLDRGEPTDALRVQILRHISASVEASRAGPGSFDLVLAAQPGGGESLFAVNLGVMRAREGGDTLLIDGALPTTEVAAALDVKTPYTVQNAIGDLGRLDRTLATSAFARHEESGLMALPLATAQAPDVDHIAPDAFARLVAALRPLFDNTILATGGVRSPALLREFMQAAGRIWFVCPQKFTAVADGRQLLDRIDPGAEAIRRITLVVDDYQPGISLSDEQMRTTLGLAAAVRLPPSRIELVNSLNVGRPLVLEQPRGPYALALARLVAGEKRCPPSASTRFLGGALSRARARIGFGEA